MSWMSRALCRTRPAEWWDPQDDGARLALALCSVCPERLACADDYPVGVIRGGVAYGDDGERLPVCWCGRPVPDPYRVECFDCNPPAAKPWRQWEPPVPRDVRIVALSRAGVSYRAIALEFGLSKSMVARIVQGARPQDVSTVVDA